MKTITVNVTQADIDANQQRLRRCVSCPVALAVQRATGRNDAAVSYQHIFFDNYSPTKPVASLPDFVRERIAHFDGGHPGKPFSFDVEIPDELLAA